MYRGEAATAAVIKKRERSRERERAGGKLGVTSSGPLLIPPPPRIGIHFGTVTAVIAT